MAAHSNTIGKLLVVAQQPAVELQSIMDVPSGRLGNNFQVYASRPFVLGIGNSTVANVL